MSKQETTFSQFRDAINKQFSVLAKNDLFQSHIPKDELWDLYLNEGTKAGINDIFRERGHLDCQCCKRFIRNVGRIIGSNKGVIKTVFDDLKITGEFKVIADALSTAIKGYGITTIYLNDEQLVGSKESFEERDNGEVHKWEHFYQVLPEKAYSLRGDVGTRKGAAQTNCKVLKRSIQEIDSSSIEIVKDLISQNSIHRGSEFSGVVNGLFTLKKEYNEAKNPELFLWEKTVEMQKAGHNCNIRGTSIGTLLVDLSNDVDLEVAVKKYEDKVSGTNYKRTTALISPKQKQELIDLAEEKGLNPSFPRRFANKTDISVNDVLFADNSVKDFMLDSVFNDLPTTKGKQKSLDKVEEMTYQQFVDNVLPKAESIELYLENKHESNLVNVIAPVNAEAPCIMRHGNNFSWNYFGETAESVIKTQVKAAGGIVDAPLRVSLSWKGRDDLDLHLNRTGNEHVFYGNKIGPDGSRLDVDMQGSQLDQIENIYWEDLSKLKKGSHPIWVKNYSKNSDRHGEVRIDGFQIEVEYLGEITNIVYNKPLRNGENVDVLNLVVDDAGNVTIKTTMKTDNSFNSKEMWNITSGEFHKVNMVMKSPNYWEDSSKIGNEHLFFIIDECINPDQARGFYSEFLHPDLQQYRKMFEVLGSKMKAEHSDDQVSGLGFSTTLRNEVTLRVKGSFNRVIKVKF